MPSPLLQCPGCHRHLRAAEPRCPFCARPHRAAPLLLVGTLVLAGYAPAAQARTASRAELVKQGGNSVTISAYGMSTPPEHPAAHAPPPRQRPGRLRPPRRRPPQAPMPAYGVPVPGTPDGPAIRH